MSLQGLIYAAAGTAFYLALVALVAVAKGDKRWR